ncbi:MAG TPA: AraC family transcriptional regulator [Blastocatellia bacterium]|nr:AraC family transcriptional regulator [Blastocatellia bacterium]
MVKRVHKVEQHKSNVQGIELMTLLTNHHFPRHSHDQFAIGVMTFGAHRSWSGIGPVQASAGDVITANPGEIHDGIPLDGNARGWRMIYFDTGLVGREIEEEIVGEVEIARPVVRDPLLVRTFTHLFECLTAHKSDRLATEENLLRCLIYLLRRHGTARPSSRGASPCVVKAIQRLDSTPERSFSLAELASLTGVSRFQLLRGFAREIGITPHAYLVQRRVRLARQLLAAGQTPAQAAAQAGFADQSHLTRAFVRHLGITPARYRAAVA